MPAVQPGKTESARMGMGHGISIQREILYTTHYILEF
jgi:hypothetical protein